MRGLWLFLRGRSTLIAFALVVMVEVLGVILGRLSFRTSVNPEVPIPWLVLLPVIPGSIIGASIRTQAAEAERGAYRPLIGYLLMHLTVLAVPAIVGTSLLASGLTAGFSLVAGLRNLAGFTALALISAGLLGGRLAWLLPGSVAITAVLLGNPQGSGFPWDWPVRPDNDFNAFAVAVVLTICAIIPVIRGTREPQQEW